MNPNQAFRMKLKPGAAKEYKKRHDLLWPELVEIFKQRGISDYSIFLDPDDVTLFAVRKVSSKSDLEIEETHMLLMEKWWDHMADLMETNPDNSPKLEMLSSVFYLP